MVGRYHRVGDAGKVEIDGLTGGENAKKGVYSSDGRREILGI